MLLRFYLSKAGKYTMNTLLAQSFPWLFPTSSSLFCRVDVFCLVHSRCPFKDLTRKLCLMLCLSLVWMNIWLPKNTTTLALLFSLFAYLRMLPVYRRTLWGYRWRSHFSQTCGLITYWSRGGTDVAYWVSHSHSQWSALTSLFDQLHHRRVFLQHSSV